MIPFVNLTAQRDAYRRELETAEKRVLDSGCYIGGPEVQALEEELSHYCGAAHTVTCGSGTQALELALMVLRLEPGDQVIVPDFTFIAPAECVQKLGGVPLFADINKAQGIDAPVKTASKFVMSESMKKFVDFYFRIAHKENPREVYTLFRDNPEKKFSANSEGVIPESTIDFKSSISDTIKGVSGVSQVSKEVTSGAEPKMSAVAMSAKLKNEPAAPAAKPAAEAKTPAAKPQTPAPSKSIIPGKDAAPAPKAAEAKEAAPAPSKSIIPDLPKKDPAEQPKDPE